MNLVIDVGNSFTKVAVFQNTIIEQLSSVPTEELLSTVTEILKNNSITHAIIASVVYVPNEVVTMLNNKTTLVLLSHELTLPFTNAYATPTTLGQDRLALIAGAAILYPKQPVLVIDAGTCITYDFINRDGVYHGGAIAPGLEMRLKAMHHFTKKLPLAQLTENIPVTGNSTQNCLLSGAVNGVTYEIDGFINEYAYKSKDLTVILTGGNTYFLSKRLKNSIFANSKFLLEALNGILNFKKLE
ncbi:type III pantothenate kinase [Neptunitalea chrysea]|uniref:Type III pantothenate kinase n=1 Tax=Neptunitalea chrysea TaxID=1647581 RepID=A0A9W6EVR8_9FLAO|nr:type III pantothenate kinase [Neptunitalea chrysea]GLB54154.1 type III pantothenate kinase [Neptunitalea chrysea]